LKYIAWNNWIQPFASVSSCASSHQGRLPTLAGRFAAKEAVVKALGCGIGPVSWKEIEIRRGEQGQPVLKLHGNACQIAEEQGLETWSISISHTREHAVAVVVAMK
jgi:holo-[acyl-carrier protein] synthase